MLDLALSLFLYKETSSNKAVIVVTIRLVTILPSLYIVVVVAIIISISF